MILSIRQKLPNLTEKSESLQCIGKLFCLHLIVNRVLLSDMNYMVFGMLVVFLQIFTIEPSITFTKPKIAPCCI